MGMVITTYSDSYRIVFNGTGTSYTEEARIKYSDIRSLKKLAAPNADKVAIVFTNGEIKEIDYNDIITFDTASVTDRDDLFDKFEAKLFAET